VIFLKYAGMGAAAFALSQFYPGCKKAVNKPNIVYIRKKN